MLVVSLALGEVFASHLQLLKSHTGLLSSYRKGDYIAKGNSDPAARFISGFS